MLQSHFESLSLCGCLEEPQFEGNHKMHVAESISCHTCMQAMEAFFMIIREMTKASCPSNVCLPP